LIKKTSGEYQPPRKFTFWFTNAVSVFLAFGKHLNTSTNDMSEFLLEILQLYQAKNFKTKKFHVKHYHKD